MSSQLIFKAGNRVRIRDNVGGDFCSGYKGTRGTVKKVSKATNGTEFVVVEIPWPGESPSVEWFYPEDLQLEE